MRDYSALSDHDFELLIADLFSAVDERRYETFMRGRDLGIDVRHSSKDLLLVIQCKNYLKSSFAQLKAAARKEASRLRDWARIPNDYRFVTSMEMSPERKSEIRRILDAFMDDDSNVYGIEDIDRLLDEHRDVEKRHMKLWLQTELQLQLAINSSIWNRSKQLLTEITTNLPKYVASAAFNDAKKLLDDNRVVVISGPPGVGKTTLARLLLGQAALEKYDVVQVSSDIEEGFAVLDTRYKQAFYYDDFLGKTFLRDRLTKNEDSRISNFINSAQASPNTLFILTTREHILHQAEEEYEELNPQRIALTKFTLEVGHYSRIDKARILANHLQFSRTISESDWYSLTKDRGYLELIDHRNYNPRLIEMITRGALQVQGGTLRERALAVLDSPGILWEQAFNHQLDDDSRHLLLVIASLEDGSTVDTIQSVFRKARSRSDAEFERSLKILDDAFITITHSDGIPQAELINPSVEDFLKSWLSSRTEVLVGLIEGASNFAQLLSIHTRLLDPRVLNERTMTLCLDAIVARGTVLASADPVSRQARTSPQVTTEALTLPGRIVWLSSLRTQGATKFDLSWARDMLMSTKISGEFRSHTSRQALSRLLQEIDVAGIPLPFAMVYLAISQLLNDGDEEAFEGLSSLEKHLPDYLSEIKLEEIRDACEELIEDRLSNPKWFGAPWEVETLRELASEWDVHVLPSRFDEIEEALSESDPEYDDFADREEYLDETGADDDLDQIDAIFESSDRSAEILD